ncbi:MAG: lysoplasmalogenase [Cyclobacteriaceae bacterium]|nr:lysoplasmalogenase [Cyclobacteriaceae bacterium]
MMKQVPFYLFIIIGAIHLAAVTFGLESVSLLSKPLIMMTLAGYYWAQTTKSDYLFITAMLFCWAGDVLLMYQQAEIFFMLGLTSFLIGHMLYIFAYRKFRFRKSINTLLPTQRIRYALPIILAGTGLVTVLYPFLGSLKVPVMIYALVITIMTLQALFRFGFTNTRSFAFILIGALLFMTSDSLLAVNKFMTPWPFASLSIMATYIAAQFLIVEGVLAHPKE